MNERIILIETSTALCSVALAEGGHIVSYRESTVPRSQASLTAPFVKEMLDERGLHVRDCDAVCVSMGPGSYTGLRVGVSTAKGLCFGAGIPLLAVGTLDVLVAQANDDKLLPQDCRYVIPMIDARRMEVYTAVFTPDGRQLTPTEPQIITGSSFAEQLSEGAVLFIGDGAEKCREPLAEVEANGSIMTFVQCCPKASAMLRPALAEFRSGNFRDIAYFEPLYLKQFVATVGKKLF